MKRYAQISDNEKWKAVVSCNKGYDGLFFYGVKTTGIFCRPSCKARTPYRKNVLFFDKAAKAMGEGFRPCKKCRPDKVVFKPNLELIKKAKDIFDVNYDKSIDLSHISKQLGISLNHLGRLFKQNYGVTPIHYIIELRLNKSMELLEQEDSNILVIAYMTGFKSLSHFYKCFKEKMGQTPNEYRKKRCGS